jgi:2,5-dihydroxypyridine 5,6-dioxygenase
MHLEPQWIDAFERQFRLCEVGAGDVVSILAETQSRTVLVEVAALALARLKCQVFRLTLSTPPVSSAVPIRSTGASVAIQGIGPVVQALGACKLVVDCTVEGLLHAPELPQILGAGARVLMVSNEHPEILERLPSHSALAPKVKAGIQLLKSAQRMTVSSAAGTRLEIALQGAHGKARIGGVWGFANKPGQIAHWPGGLCLAFPAAGSVSGLLVLDAGDVNLAFKEYLREPVGLRIENDFIVEVEGKGFEARRMRAYWQSWEDREGSRACYAVSHLGWGMNPLARWDALSFYDKRDCNGTELRAFAGNFLYSTGANEVAGRFTDGHFDLPMANCTVALDDKPVVVNGCLITELQADQSVADLTL